ncbi:transglutaminase domain-containing protein [Paratractidigestivibacter sp.]|uniref:transglutaminase domain-containing protein n=5 Tax=Paratractidigestivibacter sp. TaxID=2847316 RepID=UPI002AC9BEB3|nr:transglutaminase domain-containing protein [Paratractidigestivibacter sp.]
MKRRSLVVLFASLLAAVFMLVVYLAFCPAPALAEADRSNGSPQLVEAEANAFDYLGTDVAADPFSAVTADGGTASDKVQELVTKMTEASESLVKQITVTKGDYTVADFDDAIGLVVSNPEHYWMEPNFSYGYYDSDGDKESDPNESLAYINLSYLAAGADELTTLRQKFEAKVNEALSWVDDDTMSQFQVVQALHDYLVRNCEYNHAAASSGSSSSSSSSTKYSASFLAYGALVDGSAVCQGYTLAYKLLLSRLGVSSVCVSSTAMNHMWNLVKMNDDGGDLVKMGDEDGGGWYHVDVTWDDKGGTAEPSHTYFLRSDSEWRDSLGHYEWDAAYETPTTDYANRTYATYNGPTKSGSGATSATGYAHSRAATQNGVTFKVEWNDPVAGQDTTFHVTQTGGSSVAKARMDVPTYYDSDGSGAESVCDPSRNNWGTYYTLGDEGYDFTFSFTASGRYYMLFYFMDADNKVYYLRTNFFITIDDADHPAVSTIVANAVEQAKAATDGSEYEMALWLHDWELKQLDYDYSLNYCSAESGLTRGKGTCESFQRIYQKLLTKARLENARMEGNGHTWNAVRIGGKWYQVDVNWDDDNGANSKSYGFDATHLYFCLTDELMAVAHSDHTATYQASGYGCRSTDLSNNYFVRNGQAAEWAKAYASTIQTHLDKKETSFSVDTTNAYNPPSICGIQHPIIVYALNQMTWAASDGAKASTFKASSNVTTISNYSWTAVLDFKVAYGKVDLSGANISAISDQAWTGSEVKPAFTVTLNGGVLAEGSDYEVSYKDNVNFGTATVTVTGVGNYTGSASGTFKITKADSGSDQPAAGKVTMHRLYNKYTGEHFYTADASEKDGLVNVGWTYEGVGWTAPSSSATPVYRLYNSYVPGGDHHYTTSKKERDACVAVGWIDEGVGWYSDDAKGTPLYRQYNPYATTGTHNYTTSKAENDHLVSLGWSAEGISWYGVK